MKFVFTEDNITRYFDLNEIYLQLKKNPIKKKKEKKEGEPKQETATVDGKEKAE